MSFMVTGKCIFLLISFIFLIGDCHDSAGHKDRCVTGAIYNYSMQLSGYQDSVSDVKCKHINFRDT